MQIKLVFLFVFIIVKCSYGQWIFNANQIETTDEDLRINSPSPTLKFVYSAPFQSELLGSIKGTKGLLSTSMTIEAESRLNLKANSGISFFSEADIFFGSSQSAHGHISNDGKWAFGNLYPSDRIHLDGNIRIKDSGRLQWYDEDDRKAFVLFDGNDLYLTNEDDDSNLAGDIVINAKDDLQIVNNGNFSITIDESNKVGIGTTSPSYQLHIMGDVGFTGELTATSDKRVKKNITPLKNATSLITQLNPVSFNFRTSEFPELNFPEKMKLGLLAQEVEEILPFLVSSSQTNSILKDEMLQLKSVSYIEMIPILIQSIKELNLALDNEIEKRKELMELINRSSEMIQPRIIHDRE